MPEILNDSFTAKDVKFIGNRLRKLGAIKRNYRKDYNYIKNILEYEFPKGKVIHCEYDCGHGYGVGIKNFNGKRRAIIVQDILRCKDLNTFSDYDKELIISVMLYDFHIHLD